MSPTPGPCLTLGAAAFGGTVRRVARFVPDRGTQRAAFLYGPVLRGVMLGAGTGEVEILATNLEETGRAVLPAEVSRPGRALVDAAPLARIARHLPEPLVRLDLDGACLVITCGPATWRLLTMPTEDYPADLAPAVALGTVRPLGPGALELPLVHGQNAIARGRRLWSAPRPAARLYEPTGTQVGAPLTWRRTVDGHAAEVTGQIWSDAPGAHMVWALVEGEKAPVRVEVRRTGAREVVDP